MASSVQQVVSPWMAERDRIEIQLGNNTEIKVWLARASLCLK